MNHVGKNIKGFTLIEMMLAMSFISVLLIAIAMTVIQISNIYNQGVTLKELNQSSRAISSNLQRGISASSPFAIEGSVPATRFVKQGDWGGRLCVGQYSYIWNYGKAINNNSPSGSSLNVYATNQSTIIRFVRAIDSNGSYCTTPTKKVIDADAVELMNIGDHSLALHNFSIVSPSSAIDTKTSERLYTMTFTIGTNDQNALVADSSACKSPSVAGADPSYCAVQEFTLVVRTGNSG